MTEGLTRALVIVETEIARAEALLNVEDSDGPVFDQAQTEAGIAALRTVAEQIRAEAGGPAEMICRRCGLRESLCRDQADFPDPEPFF